MTETDEIKQQSTELAYDTENQLSSSLITIILAFIALFATAISSADILGMINTVQKWLVLSALIVLGVSIVFGLINYFANVRYHKQRALSARSDETKREQTKRSSIFILLQIILMCIGLALTITFVGTLLFWTSNGLPAYT